MVDNTRDRHIRRGPEAYANALISLLPTGQAWPRSPDSTLIRTMIGLAYYYGFVDSRAADLLERESDPRITLELLPDWERAWGLPEKCLPIPGSIAERQIALVKKMTMLGAQSRDFFMSVAEELGYEIKIVEYAPWMFGVSETGETDDGDPNHYWRWEIGAPEMRFYWTVKVNGVHYTWWRFGQAELGIDPHLKIGVPEDLECLFRRYKPAHTEIVFDFSEMGWHRLIVPGSDLAISSDPPIVLLPYLPDSTEVVIASDPPTVTIVPRNYFWPPARELVISSDAPNTASAIVAGSANIAIFSSPPTVVLNDQMSPPARELVISSNAPIVARNVVKITPTTELVIDSAAPDVQVSSLVYVDGTSHILLQDGTSRLRLL